MEAALIAPGLLGGYCQIFGWRRVKASGADRDPSQPAARSGRRAMGAIAIADAVLFLASAKASYITGVTLSMDGGQNPVL